MIDPDFFGCSGKLSYQETRMLAAAGSKSQARGDFSEVESAGRIVTSIDRVHRCARNWDRFARIALNHALADVLCAGGIPIQIMLSFEFGIDVEAAERIECSIAFRRELASRSISLGKCHSSYSSGVTAVTIATLANAPHRPPPHPKSGRIYISRPLGAFKLHYLTEMGVEDFRALVGHVLEGERDEAFHDAPWAMVTDVSGHGLLGAASQAAEIHGLDLDFVLTNMNAIAPEVLSIPVDCLQNPASSFEVHLSGVHERAVMLATLRETAGPFLGFAENDGSDTRILPGIAIGRYRQGSGKVAVSWAE